MLHKDHTCFRNSTRGLIARETAFFKKGTPPRRRTGKGVGAPALLLLLFQLCVGQSALLVCKPGTSNTQRIQSGFDELLGRGKTTAFGRIKDLEAAIDAHPDAVIVVPKNFVEFVTGFTIVLSGTMRGAPGEKYMLVASSREVTKRNIAEKRIGIVDFLGRERLGAFVKEQFGFEVTMLKRVNKNEDLLTMLGMEAVDAIIVPSSEYMEILSNTKLPLFIVSESEKAVGFMACAAKNGACGGDIKKALLAFPERLQKELGIDTWASP